MRKAFLLALVLAATVPALAATKLSVTVIDKRSGEPLTELKASDFTVLVDQTPKQVESAEFKTGVIDVVLLLDSSQIGGAISRQAPSFIGQLAEEEQMSIVAYDESAEVIQEFTSSQQILRNSLSRIRFGNSPRLLDALYAVAADGFEGATYRRVILALTTGVDGASGVTDTEVLRVCRRNGVSIYPVYTMGYGRSKLEKLARLSGGASFNARVISKRMEDPAPLIFEVMRGHYEMTLTGNLPLGDKAKIEVRGQKSKNLLVSYLELN